MVYKCLPKTKARLPFYTFTKILVNPSVDYETSDYTHQTFISRQSQSFSGHFQPSLRNAWDFTVPMESAACFVQLILK